MSKQFAEEIKAARKNGVQEFIDFSGDVLENQMSLTPHKRELAKSIMRSLVNRWNTREAALARLADRPTTGAPDHE